jgi:hypothetical protein
MLLTLNPAESSGIWDAVIKIGNPWNLAAFALAVVLFIVMRNRKHAIPVIAWVVIVLLVALPIGASVYRALINDNAIYRPRVTVLDLQHIPIEDARVWSSFGGEPKRVAGGWQFDIPEASKPKDGKLTIFASKESAFLIGQTDLMLGNEHNPAVTVNLRIDDSAKVRGQVLDIERRAISGARVCVVGYESDAILTKEGGNFELPAHAAVNQQILLHAEKPGYKPTRQQHPAGDTPAELILERKR